MKLKIKIRNKIVADGLKEFDYDLEKNGEHVNAEQFNSLLEDENTITIDMRNHYESEIGHFKGADLPDVDTFRESLPIINDKYKNTTISTRGRHDPCVGIRAVPIVEAMTACVLADHLMRNKAQCG